MNFYRLQFLQSGQDVKYGLTEKGRQQTRESAKVWVKSLASNRPLSGKVRLISSNFSRAKETAEIFKSVVEENGIQGVSLEVTAELRERFFGNFEGQSNSHYESVWAEDQTLGEEHNAFKVESINQVLDRIISFVANVEKEGEGGDWVILVSHGDCLQITQTFFKNTAGRAHRSLPHWSNAEIKELN
jgi:probable phosphoglycerate mutase